MYLFLRHEQILVLNKITGTTIETEKIIFLKYSYHEIPQDTLNQWLVVNQELHVVEEALPLLINQLSDGGRLSVITFHSLEDRLVKNIFKESKNGFVVNKKVIVPSLEECKINSRARSAKLRIFQKGNEPEKPDKFAVRRALLNK